MADIQAELAWFHQRKITYVNNRVNKPYLTNPDFRLHFTSI